MNDVFFFLHLLGAVGMGFYIVLPIMIGKATKLAGLGQGGLADGLVSANRIVQYALIIQLLTGGYMMSQADYSVAWMIIITVLFLAIAAISGIMSKPLKRIVSSIQDGQSATGHIAKARIFSLIVLILYVVVIYFMAFPMYE
ncbi:hypothetical protein M3194_22165 [Paenibacillus glycanilyticus]|uniref:hypothetical protein n=1 Tax=Paenibacillus glycanilyticus TaxID=126569 RepID=UPI00203D15D5|nr:hypothetical protein [Paenibacillus glycanilyticus]MCM3630042.1 hypothetical protein [Paenibacillus glycanilyticus]